MLASGKANALDALKEIEAIKADNPKLALLITNIINAKNSAARIINDISPSNLDNKVKKALKSIDVIKTTIKPLPDFRLFNKKDSKNRLVSWNAKTQALTWKCKIHVDEKTAKPLEKCVCESKNSADCQFEWAS